MGAGFSAAAGLPLGLDLFKAVRNDISLGNGRDNWFERDLQRYTDYLRATEDASVADRIDLEEFVGFLDREHFLGLKGKDTWSDEGNESQLMIRNSIARVLHQRTPTAADEIPAVYLEFARELTPTDWILTFNYDLLLEAALTVEGVPFRRFPHRYASVGWSGNTIDNSRDELVLLKLHGSIDWFDYSRHKLRVASAESAPMPYSVKHAVFGEHRVVKSTPLVEGPRASDDPLLSIQVVPDIGPLLDQPFWEWNPLLLPPSTAKLFGAGALREFWWGAQRGGGWNLGFSIVGYSLPNHDEYARQMLYHMTGNYTGYGWESGFAGDYKAPLRVLDYGDTEADEQALRDRYRFIDPTRSEFSFAGLSSDTVRWLFQPGKSR